MHQAATRILKTEKYHEESARGVHHHMIELDRRQQDDYDDADCDDEEISRGNEREIAAYSEDDRNDQQRINILERSLRAANGCAGEDRSVLNNIQQQQQKRINFKSEAANQEGQSASNMTPTMSGGAVDAAPPEGVDENENSSAAAATTAIDQAQQQSKQSGGPASSCCAGCSAPIRDKFIFSVIDLHWHQDCVQCSDCQLKLIEKCYTFNGKLYCRQDFWLRFGPKCSGCHESISSNEIVQRIKGNRVYHLKCFTCAECQKQLETGERVYLIDGKRLLCKQDYHQQAQQQQQQNENNNNGNGGAGGGNPKAQQQQVKHPNGFNQEQQQSSGVYFTLLNSNSSNQRVDASATNNKTTARPVKSSNKTADDLLDETNEEQDDEMSMMLMQLNSETANNKIKKSRHDNEPHAGEEEDDDDDEADYELAESNFVGGLNSLEEAENQNEDEVEMNEEDEGDEEEEDEDGELDDDQRASAKKQQAAIAAAAAAARRKRRRKQRQQPNGTQTKRLATGRGGGGGAGESILNGSNSILAGGIHVPSAGGPQLHSANYKQLSSASSTTSNSSSSSSITQQPAHQQHSMGHHHLQQQMQPTGHPNQHHHQQQQQQQQHHHHHSTSGGSQTSSGAGNSNNCHNKPTRVRTVLNEKQLQTLRDCYAHNPRPDALMKEQLVDLTGLSPRVIRVWFQNKRCKDKKKSILHKQMQQHEKDGRHLAGLTLMRGVPLVASSPIQYDDQSTVSSTPTGVSTNNATAQDGAAATNSRQKLIEMHANQTTAAEHLRLDCSSPVQVINQQNHGQQQPYLINSSTSSVHSPATATNSNHQHSNTSTTNSGGGGANTANSNHHQQQAAALDIHAYQPPWKNLIDYAQQQQQANPSTTSSSAAQLQPNGSGGQLQQDGRVNATSPRYQQLIGQIHGYNSARPPAAPAATTELSDGQQRQITMQPHQPYAAPTSTGAAGYPPPGAMHEQHHQHHHAYLVNPVGGIGQAGPPLMGQMHQQFHR